MEVLDPNDTIFNITIDRLILPYDKYLIITLTVVVYWIIFKLLDLCLTIPTHTEKKRFDVITRSISGVYAGISFVISLLYIYFGNANCGYYNDDLYNNLISISFGFYLAEFIHIYYYNLLDNRRLIHHTLVLVAEYELLILKSGAYFMVRWGLYLDATTPPLQVRAILLNIGKKDTKLFHLFENIYFSSYFFTRVFLSYFSYQFYSSCANNVFFMTISNILLLVQCVFLFLEMIKITKQRIKEYKERSSKGIKLYWIEVNSACHDLSYNQHHRSKKEKIKESKDSKNN